MKKSDFSENRNNHHEYADRRQKKDWVVRSVSIIAIVGWIIAFAAYIIIDQAKPDIENYFTRILNHAGRRYWNIETLRISFGVLLGSFVTCVTGFFINMCRHRRKTDRYNKSIIILGFITLVMILVVLSLIR